jgi:hypothetical protein
MFVFDHALNPPFEHTCRPDADAIGAIIGQGKSITATWISALRHTFGTPVWQRHNDEQIIRTDDALARIHDEEVCSFPAVTSS